MAIKIYEQFAPFANPADGDYPYGSIKNDSIPGAEDGTPLDAIWANDMVGFTDALLAEAGIAPSGNPDTVGSSQRVDAISIISGNTTYPTIAAAKSTSLPSGKRFFTSEYSTGNGGGAEYLVYTTYPVAQNGRTIVTLNSGLLAVMQHDGYATVQQSGAPLGDDIALGLAIPALISVGVSTINIPNKRVTFNGTQDLSGATLIGNETVWATGNFVNGNLVGITREIATNQFLSTKSKVQPAISKSKVKAVVKCAATPNGATSPNDELYCILSPSSYGGVSMFFIGNGTGDTGAGNLGAPFDRLRVWNTYLANNGVVMKLPDSTTGTTAPSAFDYFDKKYNGTISTRWSPTSGTTLNALNMSAGATATFTLPASRNKSNVSFYTSGGSTADATITVNGQLIKTFSAKDSGNKLKTIEFDTPVSGTAGNTIVVASGSGTLYLYGVDCYMLSDVPVNELDTIVKYNSKLVMHSFTEMTYSGTGASLDSVLVDSNGDFCGSYHGGDLAESQQCDIRVGIQQIRCTTSAYTETNPSLQLATGQFLIDSAVRVRYVGTIATTPVLSFRYSLDFGVDGGCNVTCFYIASSGDVGIQVLYTGMHSTSRQLLNTPTRTFAVTPTNSTLEIDENELPLYQFGNSNNQMLIVPSETELNKSTILARLWDDTNYLKFYYTPVALPTGNLLTLKNGEAYSFSCLYQYGRSII